MAPETLETLELKATLLAENKEEARNVREMLADGPLFVNVMA